MSDSDNRAFDLGFKHGTLDKKAGLPCNLREIEHASVAYRLGYNKGYTRQYCLIDAT